MKIKQFNVVLITYHQDGTQSRAVVATVQGIRKANEICRINNSRYDNDCLYISEEIKGTLI